MTSERSDLDRALRSWFEDGPTAMPDRVVDVIAERIAEQPQRRAWRLRGRPFMNRYLKLAAGLAAVIFVAVLVWQVLPGPSGPGVRPTPTPIVTPSQGAVAPTPAATTPWWLGSDASCGEGPGPYGCAGELSPGLHTSGGLAPTLTYTVPAGWVNYRDWATYFLLFPDTPGSRAEIGPINDPRPHIVVRPLSGDLSDCASPPPVEWSAGEILAAFAALDPSAATPTAVTIDGLSGNQVDLAVRPEVPIACPEAPPSPDGDRHRLIVLGATGAVLAITITAMPADFEAFLADAMPIVETFDFDVGP